MVTPKKDKDLERRQLKLEEGFVEAGVKRLRRRERDLARKSGLGKTRAGHDLLRECFTQLEQAIVNSQEEVLRARHLPPAALPLLGLDAGTLAFVCLHVAVGAMRDKDVQEGRWPALSNLSREVGQRCQRERKLVVKAKRAPDITKRLLIRNKNVWNAAVRAARLAAELDSDWSTEVALHLGSKLLYLAIRHCKLDGKPVFERCRTPKGRGQAKVIYLALGLTDAGVQWLDVRQRAMEEFAVPVFLPMLVPPSPWSSIDAGGYRTGFGLRLVKFRNEQVIQDALQNADLRIVYQSVNALQETPWRVNQRIYTVMHKYWTQQRVHGIAFPGAPELERKKMPDPPLESDPEPVAQKKRAERAKTFRHNTRAIGFRSNMRVRLSFCRRQVKVDRFYFPYQLDKRGRVYPIPQAVHPQADDIGRALLEFADAKPIGKDGGRWFAIHLANLHGEDKLSFDERERWVTEHERQILACAEAPLDMVEFWSKADKRWCFLAACLEWRDYKQSPLSFCSHLPVSMDGTCNGLQHLSALGRDPDGGKATNLVPADRPADVYKEVAARVAERVAQDRDRGIHEAFAWECITRDLAKHATMTTPYGVTLDGIKKGLLDKIEDGQRPFAFPIETHDPWKSAQYLAKILKECIAAVVSKASEIEKWLVNIVNLLAKQDRGLRWSVPTGLVILHDYRQVKEARVKTLLGTLVVYRSQDKPKIYPLKQRSAIVANFVHSLDAAHMMMTVTQLHKLGIRHFAMIHDSYGVHACDVPLMNKVLRQQFVKLYERDVLNEFLTELRQHNPKVLLPAPPALGTLEIKHVEHSMYFFA